MAVRKTKTVFICQSCGTEHPKWGGQCTACQEWNTLVEEKVYGGGKKSAGAATVKSGHTPQKISGLGGDENRFVSTGIDELDRVLGGGIYPGAMILVGGAPGIGKSTLILQAALKAGGKDRTVLYVSGEESEDQIAQRSKRLELASDAFLILSETSLEQIEHHVRKTSPKLLVIDSIQTMYTESFTSAPGSVGQIRECTARLMQMCKQNGIAVFIIGHVTKDGAIAGPRMLEHMVDTVLYFEGDAHHWYRMLRAVKNRFGSTNELGLFEMGSRGLQEVLEPGRIFLKERSADVPGSVITVAVEGTRPLVIEIQGLVTPSYYNVPRRVTTGVDYNRVALLLAILEKRARMNVGNSDSFVNVVGGLRVTEPAIDLAILLGLATSFRDRSLPVESVVLGEVGLSGEVRSVPLILPRLKEIEKLGFKNIILPAGNAEEVKSEGSSSLMIHPVETIKDALTLLK